MTPRRTRRTYDHRLRQLVRQSGDVELALRRGVPRSTARDWSRSAAPIVVSLDVLEMGDPALQREVVALRERNARLLAVLRLLVVLVKVLGVRLGRRRLADGAKKAMILGAVERSRSALSLRTALAVIGLSSSRYHAWKREGHCELEDASSCPHASPHRLTVEERRVMREMATSEEYRHVPTGTLAVLAQRLGKVFASAATWHRLVRRSGLKRPRRRVHPDKPKVGIRASAPDEIWHIDTTLIRLLDGSRAYLHAVIDNFSRRILSWRVAERFDPANAVSTLLESTRNAAGTDASPTLLADAGVENVNSRVDELIESGALRRVLAMTEIAFSNSMIESWWRSLKHQWLYLNTLDSVASVRHLTEFYVREHNSRLPHSAFRGQTPDEMYFRTGTEIPSELEAKRAEARAARLEANRALSCASCGPVDESPDATRGGKE